MSIGLPDEASPLESLPTPGNAGILVVDEDPAFQLGLKTFLHEYVGFSEVFTARSGPEALALIESEETIEVVTLDYQMPGMNGIEVMEKLRDEAPRPLSVLMITGYPSEELEAEFKSFSSPVLLADHFLHKPVAFEKLEPLVLQAHEELLAAKVRAESVEELNSDETEESLFEERSDLADIESSLSRQETKIDALSGQVRTLRRKARRDTCLLALLIIAIGAAIHFGWFTKVEEIIQDVRRDLTHIFTPATDPETTPAEIAPTAESDSASEGSPL
ncbi:MAG: response regulator [Verrucomicrobiales bacterium]|nr:response regulator [Verrucomicrobiales bacterium]